MHRLWEWVGLMSFACRSLVWAESVVPCLWSCLLRLSLVLAASVACVPCFCVLCLAALLWSLWVAVVLASLPWFPLFFVGFPRLRSVFRGGVLFLCPLRSGLLPLLLRPLQPLLPALVAWFLRVLLLAVFGFLFLRLRPLSVCRSPRLGFLLVLVLGLPFPWPLAPGVLALCFLLPVSLLAGPVL